MCGIAGILGLDIRGRLDKTIHTMRSSILYRGLDEQNDWSDDQYIHLMHSRLSIIDIASGSQPMWDASGRFVIVHNGEIYNYKELQERYKSCGARFRTQSDTEVILEGFKLKRERICSELNGMFAFAIWDSREKLLFLARDHLGKKPLFWCIFNEIFYFASTLDAFRAIPGWSGKLSLSALVLYRFLGGFPEDVTIYSDAYAVPYASWCFVRPGYVKVNPQRYWQMKFSPKSNKPLEELLEEYETLLIDAVAMRLRSDVPIAHMLSGGVDSGSIASIACRKTNVKLNCYTIDYHTPDDPSEETIIAQRVARHLNLEWHYVHFDYHSDLLRDLPEAYKYYDFPSVQLALVYSHRLYQAIKPYATVVLSGNGADELFTGYIGDEKIRLIDIVRERKIKPLRWAQPITKALWSLCKDKGYVSLMVNYLGARFFNFLLPVSLTYAESLKIQTERLIGNDSRILEAMKKIGNDLAEGGVDSHLDAAMFANLAYATSDSNYRLPDVSGLAAQVEVRSPFLDYRIVDYATRLPHHFKVGNPTLPSQNKYLPKLYYERLVPRDIAWARKKGMGSNLRWDKSIIEDPGYRDAFKKAYDTLDRCGIDSTEFRDAWLKYRSSKGDLQYSTLMMMGFMLGVWLSRAMWGVDKTAHVAV